ncbi:MAG: hypothetical protein E5X10_27530 [Mesorhizobium sp.]|nr:MAG: hypothetical protein E5X10_27530 [Mesorhizobium sp.]
MEAIGRYLLQNPEKIAFATCRDIAASVGASRSSVSRFVGALGFASFAELETFSVRIFATEKLNWQRGAAVCLSSWPFRHIPFPSRSGKRPYWSARQAAPPVAPQEGRSFG